MSKSMIDRLYDENNSLIELLTSTGEISYINNIDESFRKTLLLSAASYFEHKIREYLIFLTVSKTNNSNMILSLVKNKAISRQYHTYFSWKEKNANSFFGLFGQAFKDYMQSEISNNSKLKQGIKDFLELGELRNLLVHEDFASFPLEKTVNEIYELYKSANFFVESLPEFFQNHKD